MTPDEIRKLYHATPKATEAEAAAAHEEITTDLAQSRRLVHALIAMARDDSDFALLSRAFLDSVLFRLIEERMAQDDAFALECGSFVLALMEKIKPGSTPRKAEALRGKPKQPKTA